MSRLRKWRRPALVLVALVVLAQVLVSSLARTPIVHGYLVRHLENSFGRSVEVRHFGALLFPTPVLEAEQVTVAEDPAFGNEYFLRAEHLTARLRWSGLLRGHFEFGTLSFTRPSLILVHNAAGSWNLERWLPPAKKNPANLPPDIYGPQQISSASNRLQKIDIDDGRLNFKSGNDKLPLAFTGVSGSVEQVAPGRWRLDLQAQPWRSGVVLQSAGTAYVRGDVAGTSARLQPAEIHVHWDDVSLADLFRLIRGQDYGVRGLFALDAVVRSGGFQQGAAANLEPGEWAYSLQVRATEIHRWDLTERRDNPDINVNAEGHWNALTRTASAERLVVETSKSNLRGTAHVSARASPSWELHIDSAGIQASDLLAWGRAFYPDIDEKVSAQQFFTGALTLRGWPLELQDAAFSSRGGELRIPGLRAPVRVSAFSGGGRQRGRFIGGPMRLSYGEASGVDSPTPDPAASKSRSGADAAGFLDVSLAHDFARHSGAVSLDGHLERVEDALTFAAAFGRSLNRGWELSGAASVALHRDWDAVALRKGWNGRIDVAASKLQVAGLNRPLQIGKARLEWNNGARTVQVAQINAFGAQWSGLVARPAPLNSDSPAKWSFRLHADHLDAADLDRWIGPRARPGWLQRLLPSLLGRLASNAPATAASELLRRINAEGELRVDEFTLEKIRLNQIRADISVHDLRLEVLNSDAEWAGGKIGAKVRSAFSPRPSYDIMAQFDRVSVAQLPAAERIPETFTGQASGSVHLTTQGLGRDELLQNLAGKGEIKLRDVEFNGWDVSASVADGQPRAGASRWLDGEGAFTVRDRSIEIPGLRLDAGTEITLVKGSVDFGRQTDLTVQIAGVAHPEGRTLEGRRILKISGPLELPHVSIETLIARQPAD